VGVPALPVALTVALRVAVAPDATGFGVTVRTVAVAAGPGGGVVLDEPEPPHPKRDKKPTKAPIESAARMRRSFGEFFVHRK
jgi:hypothetical protein